MIDIIKIIKKDREKVPHFRVIKCRICMVQLDKCEGHRVIPMPNLRNTKR